MKVVILQDKVDYARAIARLLGQEISVLKSEQIKTLPDEKINNTSSLLQFLEQNKNIIQIVMLDVHLKIDPTVKTDARPGLRIYQKMIEQELFNISIIVTSFESLEDLSIDVEFGHYFQPECLSFNPFIQFPVVGSELCELINQILMVE